MKGAVVVAMALAAAMIVGVAGDSTNPLCDPTYECQFKVTTADNSQYTYDLSGLCSDSQWVLHDAKRHTYYANICGYAKQNCLPLGWTNNYEMGVTVQMWGAPPAGGCQNRCTSHASGTAQPACCTADCQVKQKRANTTTTPKIASLTRDHHSPRTCATGLTLSFLLFFFVSSSSITGAWP